MHLHSGELSKGSLDAIAESRRPLACHESQKGKKGGVYHRSGDLGGRNRARTNVSLLDYATSLRGSAARSAIYGVESGGGEVN